MREAARALDDVSDHLGEVLRRADELLAEWSQFGAQVRAQVEREVAAISGVVDDAVARAAGAGIDRAVADRLRALTSELERLEQRTRAASRAVVEHRDADRRVLWVVVAGVVLANALLVVLLLRKPEPAPVAEPIRIESPTPASPAAGGAETASANGSADGARAVTAGSASTSANGSADGARAVTAGSASTGSAAPTAGSNAPSVGATTPGAGSSAAANPASGAMKAAPHAGAAKPPEAGARPAASPIALPPKGNTHHKKLP